MTDARLLSLQELSDVRDIIGPVGEWHWKLVSHLDAQAEHIEALEDQIKALEAERTQLRELLGELRAYVGKLEAQYVPMQMSHSYMPGLPATDDEIKSLAARLAAALSEEG